MGKSDRLWQRACDSPQSVTYRDLVWLAKQKGFILDRTEGSHAIFIHPKAPGLLLNFQRDPKDLKMAKAYQVRQFVSAVDEIGLADKKEE